MKSLKICLVLLLACFPVLLSAQAKPDTSKINFIKAQFVDVNSHISTYKTVHRNDMGLTTEGGEATAYFDGNDLKKILSVFYGETGRVTLEYYFQNGKLIFFYKIDYFYNWPFNVAGGGKIVSTTEGRYYFDGSNIIKYINKPQKALSATSLNKEAKEDLTEVARLVKLINNKDEEE